MALEFNRELLWFCFSSFYDWSKKITPLYQPIKFKTKPSRVLIDRVFPRCRQLTYFYSDFSLTPQPIKFKTKASRVLVDRVFPRCRKLTYFYSDFSLTPQPIKLKTKTNRVFPRFTLVFTLISHWFLNQSNSKLKPAAFWLTMFSRASGS